VNASETTSAIPLHVRRTRTQLEAILQSPAFDLARREVDVESSIYSTFRRFGAELGDIEIAKDPASLDRFRATCRLGRSRALVEFRLDRIAVRTRAPWTVAFEAASVDIASCALQVLREVSTNSTVSEFRVRNRLDGVVERTQALSLIEGWVTTAPAGEGLQFRPQTVAFECEVPARQGHGRVRIACSRASEPDAMSVRLWAALPGSLGETEAFNRAFGVFREACERMGFEPRGVGRVDG